MAATNTISTRATQFLNILSTPDANAEYEREQNVGCLPASDLDEEDLRYISYQITGIIYWIEQGTYDLDYYRSLVLDLLSYDPIGLSYIDKSLRQSGSVDFKNHRINTSNYTSIADEALQYVNLTEFEYNLFALICVGIADPEALSNFLLSAGDNKIDFIVPAVELNNSI